MLVQMLNCISGMVEKTQRAISILQQRQAEAGSARSAEELVADIQARASSALMEVKLAALEEIRAAKQGAADTAQPGQQSKNKDEVILQSIDNSGVPYHTLSVGSIRSSFNLGKLTIYFYPILLGF